MAQNDNFSVMLVTDNTGSMASACESASTSVYEMRSLVNLLNGKPCVDVAVIGDYDDATPNNDQGGWTVLNRNTDTIQIKEFMTKYMKPIGGGGMPEAYKTALNHIHNFHDSNIVFLFLDAVPHDESIDALDDEGRKEKQFIEQNGMIWSWDELTSTFRNKSNVRVVTFLTQSLFAKVKIWQKLGAVVQMLENTPRAITDAMLYVFNTLIGVPTSLPKGFVPDRIEPFVELDLSAKLKKADPIHVLDAFDFLLDPSEPGRAMCLTTNPILGKYWRLICGRFKYINDRMYEPRCQQIMNKLSVCKEKLETADQKILKEWIDASHNETEVVRAITQRSLTKNPQSVLVLDSDAQISLDEVLDLGRGGNFKEVFKLISSLKSVDYDKTIHVLSENEDESPSFIPDTVEKANKLSLIANLLSPGLIFSRNESFMVAILALGNKFLSDLATEHLTEFKGKWINWGLDGEKQLFPIFWSLNFMRLLKLAPNELLTEEEIKFRDHYLFVSNIVRNQDTTVKIKTPLMFKDLHVYPTWKRLCPETKEGCGQSRCFTIFPGDSDICGICISTNQSLKNGVKVSQECYKTPSTIVENKTDISLAQCSSCRGNYGISCPEHLNVRPKCYNCRFNVKNDLAECFLCLGKYVNPGNSALIALVDKQSSDVNELLDYAVKNNKFVCPRCNDFYKRSKTDFDLDKLQDTVDTIAELDVKISDLIKQNTDLIKFIPIDEFDTLVGNQLSLWKKVIKCKETNRTETDKNIKLSFYGYSVHKCVEVIDNLLQTLTTHSGIETCQMCVSDVPVRNVHSACTKCRNRLCENCIKGWYSQVSIGSLVTQGTCYCPFCKEAPIFKTIRGLVIRHVRNLRVTKANKGVLCEWNPKYVYGVCVDCLNLKPAFERECIKELPNVTNFVCTECTELREIKKTAHLNQDEQFVLNKKVCPNCKAPTEKAGGCNHITCICGTHWCWVCEGNKFSDDTVFDSRTIYDHMAKCGGIFSADINIEDDIDSDDDY